MSDFTTKTVETLCQEGVLFPPLDGNHGEIHPKASDYVASGIPFIMASDIENGRVDIRTCSFIKPEQASKLRKGFSRPGDVLLTHKATIGRSAIVGELETPFIMLTPQVTYYRVRDEQSLDNRFLYYYFNSKKFMETLQQWSGAGSTRAYLGITGQKKLPILIPPIKWQRKIADVLGSLDDKIELNRRMNETLEAMAQAIFRDWFVDFGPTRRKLEGASDPVEIMGGLVSDANRAQAVADLFPEKFGGDGLPVGWINQSLLEQAHWINGAAYKNMHFSESDDALPVVKIAELKNGVNSGTKRTNTALGEKYRITDGEVLFSWSGNPDTSIDAFFWIGGEAWLNQHIFAVRENGLRSKAALYVLLKSLMPQFAELARNKQTTGLGHVTKDDMKRLEIPVAAKDVEQAFETFITPFTDLLESRLFENRTLAATRDFLLPKLMSGEIHLGEAAEMAEAAQ